MSGLLAVIRRELQTKRFLFLASLVIGLLMPAFALLPSAAAWGRGTFVLTIAGVVTFLMTQAVAMILGATVVGRDLSERRLSFYLSKPLSAATIWSGKVIGSVIAIIAVMALLLMPSLLLFVPSLPQSWPIDAGGAVAATLALALLLFFAAHAAGTMIRARSPWILLDLVLFAAACGVAWLLAQPLLLAGAFEALNVAGAVLGTLLAIVLVTCGVFQLARGRADLRRNHGALSTFLWTGVALALLIAGGYVAWLTHPSPRDLRTMYATQGRSAGWVIVTGETRRRFDFEPAFLMAVDGSAQRRLPPSWRAFITDPVESHDGRWLGVATRAAFGDQAGKLVLYDLRRIDAPVRTTAVPLPMWPLYALSDDAAMIAAWDNGKVTVSDVTSGRILASARIQTEQPRPRVAMFFTNTALRVFVTEQRPSSKFEVQIYELALAAKKLRRVTTLSANGSGMKLSTNSTGSLNLLRSIGGPATVYDETGRELLRIMARPGEEVADARFLDDDRVAVILKSEAQTQVMVFSLSTGQTTVTRLSGKRHMSIQGELAPGLMLVGTAVRTPGAADVSRYTSVLNLMHGGIVLTEPFQTIGELSGGWLTTDPREQLHTGERVFSTADGSLVAWDPIASRKRVLLKHP